MTRSLRHRAGQEFRFALMVSSPFKILCSQASETCWLATFTTSLKVRAGRDFSCGCPDSAGVNLMPDQVLFVPAKAMVYVYHFKVPPHYPPVFKTFFPNPNFFPSILFCLQVLKFKSLSEILRITRSIGKELLM